MWLWRLYAKVHEIKALLCDVFKNEIIITGQGKTPAITLRKTAEDILLDFHKIPKEKDPQTEKLSIIRTAAALIKSDIKSSSFSTEYYPDPCRISSISQNL